MSSNPLIDDETLAQALREGATRLSEREAVRAGELIEMALRLGRTARKDINWLTRTVLESSRDPGVLQDARRIRMEWEITE